MCKNCMTSGYQGSTSPDMGTTDHDYKKFSKQMKETFKERSNGKELFQTDVTGLFDVFLNNLPYERHIYDCRTCRKFFERYGGVVTIEKGGKIRSAVWDNHFYVPTFFSKALDKMIKIIEDSTITGVFYSEENKWGIPKTGQWNHFSVTPKTSQIHKDRLNTPFQAQAEKKQDFINVTNALKEYNVKTIEQAVGLLEGDALYRSEKCLGQAEFLRDLHKKLGKKRKYRANLMWQEIAKAPKGFCHPRSSMIGTLLDDISSGMNFRTIEKRFAEKMRPTAYQRPKAAPKVQNRLNAEKIVTNLGIENSLKRRFARLEEIQCIWKPKVRTQRLAGVFANVSCRSDNSSSNPFQMDNRVRSITMEKFIKTILPKAQKIELRTPGHYQHESFAALLTAQDRFAPPILQWDREDERNPVSHYMYNNGSRPSEWNLKANEYVNVTGISYTPSMWNGNKARHQSKGAMFILQGCKDYRQNGNALFPESLRQELRSVRSTIEAYSKTAILGGVHSASACGYMYQDSGYNARTSPILRVSVNGVITKYQIDRWA